MGLSQTHTGGVESNIAVAAWDATDLRVAAGRPPDGPGPVADLWWDELDEASAAPDEPSPRQTWYEHNITCEGLHAHLADCLNPTTPTDSNAARVSFAVGTGSPTPAVTDTSLAAPAGTFDVTQYTQDARSVSMRCVLSTTQANGIDISEMGVVADSGLWNHAVFSPAINKTASIALTIEVMLSLQDVSEVSA